MVLNLCPPQQTGFTNSLNCSAAQHKSPAAGSPSFLAVSQGEPKGTEHHNNSLTLQHGDFHVRHPYLSCHCVKHLRVFLRADPSWWKVFLWNKSLLTSLLAPPCAKSPAPTWLLYHCREYPEPPRSSPPDQGTWPWLCEQMEQRGWAYSPWLMHCRMGAISQSSRDSTGAFTALKQEWKDLSNKIATV